jgi:rSAM/selenodomain-associated transferase 1
MPIPILDPNHPSASQTAARAGVCALAIMAKAPRPGTVKTRLSPPLTPQQATALSICFLRDTAENIAAVADAGPNASGLVAYTPAGDETLFEGLLPHSFVLLAQRGDGFGERLLAAAQDILACGYSSVCLIDADSPTVPRAAYRQAVAELARPGDRIVLGPSADGGYYLIGMKRPHAAVFERIHWSTGTVFAETRDRAHTAGIDLVELPLWYDVDDAPTLDLLRTELLAGIAPGFAIQPGYAAPHSREFLLAHNLASTPTPRPTPSDPVAVLTRDQDSGHDVQDQEQAQ